MYVCLSKAMDGTLKAALLYYRFFSKDMREYGLFINPYKPCVANKWKTKGQFTVVWHVDGMKVSHRNKEEVTKCFEYMKVIYGEKIPILRGKKHTYVGMDLDYISPGEVIVSMYSYITEAIDEFPEEMMKTIKTLAGNQLF